MMELSVFTINFLVFDILILIYTLIHITVNIYLSYNKREINQELLDKKNQLIHFSLVSILSINFIYKCVQIAVILGLLKNGFNAFYDVIVNFISNGNAFYISIVFGIISSLFTQILVYKTMDLLGKSKLIKSLVSVTLSHGLFGLAIFVAQCIIFIIN